MAAIGLSLPYEYLSGVYSSLDSRAIYETFGPAQKALELFQLHEVQSIEIRHFPQTAPADMIVKACSAIWQPGLRTTIHPATPAATSISRLDTAFPWITGALKEMPRYQEELLIVLHACAEVEGSEKAQRRCSEKLFTVLADWTEENGAPLKFALELNRAKGRVDPSTTYESVTQLCTEINRTRVGICWDWGHSYANFLTGLMERDPPAAFLDRVIHTHIHSVGPTGSTHWPLSCGRLPLPQYTSILLDKGFQGLFTIELSPYRFTGQAPLDSAVLDSILLLKNTINDFKQCRS